MKMNTLGHTGIAVSEVCLGTMTYGEQNTVADSFEQLDYAQERGVNFLDTAELYAVPPKPETQGLTEDHIGQWFAARGNRDKWVVATKVVGRSGAMNWFRKDRSLPKLDAGNIREAVEGSLRRLRTDHIDLYQLHWPDRPLELFSGLNYVPTRDPADLVAPEETLRTLQDLIADGQVRAIGLSNETPWGLMSFLAQADHAGLPRVASVQNCYNLLNRVDEIAMSEIYYREGISSLPYSPLGQGTLTGKYIGGAMPEGSRKQLFNRMSRYETPGADDRVREYKILAEAHGLSLATMSLAFCKQRGFITATIIGATKMDQLREDIDAFGVDLTDDVIAGINDIHLRQPNPCP